MRAPRSRHELGAIGATKRLSAAIATIPPHFSTITASIERSHTQTRGNEMAYWEDTHRDTQAHWEQFKPQIKPEIDWEEVGDQAKTVWHKAVDAGVDVAVRMIATFDRSLSRG